MKSSFIILSFILTLIRLNSQTFVSSNLPIVIINTNGQFIQSDPKVTVDFKIKYHVNGSRNYLTDPDYYSWKIGIETRGSSSANFAKVSYGFETLDSNLLEVDTPLINMPAGSDWILNASHSDKTFLRNVLPHYMYRQLGNYSPRSTHVELVIDGVYEGVYLLMEKIKRGKNRLKIAKLGQNDTSATGITGGYILKSDKPTGSNGTGYFLSQGTINSGQYHYGYTYEYPSDIKLHPKQKIYIKKYVDSAESALYGNQFMHPQFGYRQFFNEQTFMDYIIVNEYAKNSDTYVLSTYFYKPKNNQGREFAMGPVWDFDLSFKNSYYFDSDRDTGFIYTTYPRIKLFSRMMQDSTFKKDTYCRWKYLRQTTLSTSNLFTWVDSIALHLQESQTRNFAKWPILGQNVYYNSFPYPLTFNDEIDSLKIWLKRRGDYLDNMWAVSNCPMSTLPQMIGKSLISLSPNPATQICTLQSYEGIRKIEIRNVMGQKMLSAKIENDRYLIQMSDWPKGVYTVSVQNSKGENWVARLIKE
jgi:CotH kinase protein/Secretion system C-terminal sorting domain